MPLVIEHYICFAIGLVINIKLTNAVSYSSWWTCSTWTRCDENGGRKHQTPWLVTHGWCWKVAPSWWIARSHHETVSPMCQQWPTRIWRSTAVQSRHLKKRLSDLIFLHKLVIHWWLSLAKQPLPHCWRIPPTIHNSQDWATKNHPELTNHYEPSPTSPGTGPPPGIANLGTIG